MHDDLKSRLSDLDNIIVLLKENNRYSWYLSRRDFWIMDYAKLSSLFDPNDTDFSERFDIGILSEKTLLIFLEHMLAYKISKSEMTKVIIENVPLKSWDECSHLFPSLFLDFDSKTLFSVYGESFAFENYVPDGWRGVFENFYDLIPDSEKYWIANGCDHFKALLKGY